MNQKDELNAIKDRITKLKPSSEKNQEINKKFDALCISIEIVAGVIVGLITGVCLDKVFATKPMFIIICLVLGMMASARTIWQKFKSGGNNGA